MFVILIICVAIITAIFVGAFIKAKRRIQYANTRSGMRAVSSGNSRLPSWIKDNDKVHEFYYVLSKLAVRRGVPEDFATKAVSTGTNVSIGLAHCAGAMEAEGASFNAQKLGAADMLFEMWSKTSAEQHKYLLTDYEGTRCNEDQQETSSHRFPMLQEIDEIASDPLSDKDVNNYQERFVESYFAFVDSAGDIRPKDVMKKRPSWFGVEEVLKDFSSYLTEESFRHGVAESYIAAVFINKEFLNAMVGCIASAESHGFDFEQQKGVGVEFIKRGWRNLDDERQSMARNISLDDEDIEALCNSIN